MIKKVLFVLPSPEIGGAENVMKMIAAHLINIHSPNDVHLYFLKKGRVELWMNSFCDVKPRIVVSPFGREVFGGIHMFFYFLFNRFKYDIVFTTHSHMNAAVSVLRVLGILKSKFHVARESSVPGDRFFGLKKLLYKTYYFLYRDIDVLVCQTKYMRSKLISFGVPLKEERIIVIRNPIVGFQNYGNINPYISETHYNILMVARFHPVKNHLRALDAFRNFVGRVKNAQLYFLGDGPGKAALKEFVGKDSVLSGRVHFLGFSTRPQNFMHYADMGLLASDVEGFPNVLAEMCVSGTTSIVSTPCSPDVESIPGVTVSSNFTSKALSEAMLRAMIFDSICTREDRMGYLKENGVSNFIDIIYRHLLSFGNC